MNKIREKDIVFICGPMTGCKNYNRDAFMLKQMELIAGGVIVLNPAMLPDGLEREQYLTITRGMIRVSDVICLLPGWENSEGAKLELLYAMKHKKWPINILDKELQEKIKEAFFQSGFFGGYVGRSAVYSLARPAEKGADEFRVPHGFRCSTTSVKDAEPQRATEYALLPRQGVLDVAEKLTWISGVLEGVQARFAFASSSLKLSELAEAKAAADEAYNVLCKVLADEVME
ncbi:DUF4406 domain-containing protein [Salmonella enterica]|nr:DUF4406 domain-containing protein [Salmonella enterica]ELX2844752.1 DUF4406 domain-containing protein [Salmonella enterica]